MGKIIDETGSRFGRLTVIARRGSKSNGAAAWLCRCDCNNETIIPGTSLRSGGTRSCGCLQREICGQNNTLSIGEAAFNLLHSSIQKSAKKRNLIWTLTKKQVKNLSKQNCHYCGAEPQNRMRSPSGTGDYIYNGLDRVNNSKSYTIDNVVSCCKICNFAKNTMTTEQFKEWLTRAYKHFVEE